MAGELTMDEAVASGRLRAEGERELLDRFAEVFRLPPPRTVAVSNER